MLERALQYYFSSLFETSMAWLNAVADKSSIVGGKSDAQYLVLYTYTKI